jgi:hypothetical protein
VSAVLAGIAGALYVPQVGIINPSEFSPTNSIEAVVWVAIGGRGSGHWLRGRCRVWCRPPVLVITLSRRRHDEAERRPLREVGEVGVDGAHEAAPGRSSMSSMAAVAR